MSQHVWEAYRKIVAQRDGYKCYYCKVPTAATIEHLTARTKSGGSKAENLVIACPWCNTHKGNKDIKEFIETKGYKTPEPPENIGENFYDMLQKQFNYKSKPEIIATGSTNSKIAIKNQTVILMVRAGSKDQWQQIKLGPVNNKNVLLATYDFMVRHYMGSQKRKPPHYYKKKK